jgi:hypothetical protein
MRGLAELIAVGMAIYLGIGSLMAMWFLGVGRRRPPAVKTRHRPF